MGEKFIKHAVRPITEDVFHHSGEFRPAYIPRFDDPDKFVDAKVKLLREHFCINVTDEDIEYLRSFRTEGEINVAVKKIINKYWE